MTETSNEQKSEEECIKIKNVPRASRVPTDPLYFKTYYLEKMKGVRYHCELCNCTVPNENKTRHFKAKKHIRKVIEKQNENYSEFD